VQITEGLQEGDQLIVNPPAGVKEGQTVKPERRDNQ
jgi:HlyD family secretion protein